MNIRNTIRAVDRNASRPSAGPRAGRIARPTDKYPLRGGPGLAPVSQDSPNLWIWNLKRNQAGVGVASHTNRGEHTNRVVTWNSQVRKTGLEFREFPLGIPGIPNG